MPLREAVPKPLRGPLGFGSLGVMLAGMVLGYIIVLLGITLYFNMNGNPTAGELTKIESLQVMLVGVVLLGLGYLGWKGFLTFSY
jgi:hypothetical protein